MKFLSFETAKKGFDVIQRVVDLLPQSIEDVLRDYSEVPQNIILSSEKDGLEFVTGRFHVEYMDRDKVKIGAIVYFKDSNQKWIVKEDYEIIPLKYFILSDRHVIMEEKSISYELLHPDHSG